MKRIRHFHPFSCICPTFMYEFHSCVIKVCPCFESSIYYFINFIQILRMSFSYLCPTFFLMSEFHSYVINSSVLRIFVYFIPKKFPNVVLSHLSGEHHPFVSHFHVLYEFHSQYDTKFIHIKTCHPFHQPSPSGLYPTHLILVGTKLPHK